MKVERTNGGEVEVERRNGLSAVHLVLRYFERHACKYGGGFDAVWHHYAVEAETGAQVIGHGLRYGEEAVGMAYEVGASYAGGMEREKSG